MSDEKVTIEVPLELARRQAESRTEFQDRARMRTVCRAAVEEHEARQRDAERKQLEGWEAVDRGVVRRGWMVEIPNQHGGTASTLVHRDGTSDFSELQAKTMAAAPEAFEALDALLEAWDGRGSMADAVELAERAAQKRRTG